MADRNPQSVAALALTFRELYRAHITSPEGLHEDYECMPDELGLLVRAVAGQLTDLDWLILETFENGHPSWAAFAEEVHGVAPARGEALLHAWPPEGGLAPIGAAWTFGMTGKRWEAV